MEMTRRCVACACCATVAVGRARLAGTGGVCLVMERVPLRFVDAPVCVACTRRAHQRGCVADADMTSMHDRCMRLCECMRMCAHLAWVTII